jgi:hypothetical protein
MFCEAFEKPFRTSLFTFHPLSDSCRFPDVCSLPCSAHPATLLLAVLAQLATWPLALALLEKPT